jgi:hypothetical protein
MSLPRREREERSRGGPGRRQLAIGGYELTSSALVRSAAPAAPARNPASPAKASPQPSPSRARGKGKGKGKGKGTPVGGKRLRAMSTDSDPPSPSLSSSGTRAPSTDFDDGDGSASSAASVDVPPVAAKRARPSNPAGKKAAGAAKNAAAAGAAKNAASSGAKGKSAAGRAAAPPPPRPRAAPTVSNRGRARIAAERPPTEIDVACDVVRAEARAVAREILAEADDGAK